MKIEDLNQIINSPDDKLIKDVNNSSDISESKIFKIMVLEERGLLDKVRTGIASLEKARGSFKMLSENFCHRHKAKNYLDLVESISQGRIPESFSDINSNVGESLQTAGEIIITWLVVSTLFIGVMVVSSLSGNLSSGVFAFGYFFYGIYVLISIVRFANSLKNAGKALIKN